VTDRKEAVRIAVACFPLYAGEIKHAYEESSEFRSVCADLLACDRALTHWSKVNTDDGAARREEYGELLESLKQDVLDWLASHGLLRDDEVKG
jgi:hypothetical protein